MWGKNSGQYLFYISILEVNFMIYAPTHATNRKNESEASTLRLATLIHADNVQAAVIEELLTKNTRLGKATSSEHALFHRVRIVCFRAGERECSDAATG